MGCYFALDVLRILVGIVGAALLAIGLKNFFAAIDGVHDRNAVYTTGMNAKEQRLFMSSFKWALAGLLVLGYALDGNWNQPGRDAILIMLPGVVA